MSNLRARFASIHAQIDGLIELIRGSGPKSSSAITEEDIEEAERIRDGLIATLTKYVVGQGSDKESAEVLWTSLKGITEPGKKFLDDLHRGSFPGSAEVVLRGRPEVPTANLQITVNIRYDHNTGFVFTRDHEIRPNEAGQYEVFAGEDIVWTDPSLEGAIRAVIDIETDGLLSS